MSELKALRTRINGMKANVVWAKGRVLHDSIETMKDNEGTSVKDSLGAAMATAQKELLIESAYFVVEDDGIKFTRTLAERGVHVRVLTNSLASNNVLAAQSGHSKNRVALVNAGMDLYELRPDAESVMSQVASQGLDCTASMGSDIATCRPRPTLVSIPISRYNPPCIARNLRAFSHS